MKTPRLFHFSDDPAIALFEPRPVRVPSERAPGRAWLNGPLVWAIEEAAQAMYLFPRDCPRIVLWRKPETTAADLAHWWGARDCQAIAHIEWRWFERVRAGVIHRYEFAPGGFESLDDAGMWVSRQPERPKSMETLDDLPAAMAAAGVELRVMKTLTPLRDVWSSSLHASGVRLRNAIDWEGPTPALAKPL
ncbi:MAG TPA: hypothetical protein VFE13_21165 [Caulobacteraceae bacterium]|jgi:hypothetical protein|nr:hypothetical protein [Caulobacteraceae bacterium]